MVLTDWHALLTAAAGFQAQPGATAAGVALLEERLQATLSAQLRKLYLVSDGVYDQRGQWYVIWPLAEVLRRNELDWAADGAGRRELLGFGDDGIGAPFCAPRNGGSGVFSWNPVDAAPYWLANDVDEFWIGWTTGEITT
ncbi:SMI1/KNR4 family protein [Micromonosporaceae bacterium Da 78-11]